MFHPVPDADLAGQLFSFLCDYKLGLTFLPKAITFVLHQNTSVSSSGFLQSLLWQQVYQMLLSFSGKSKPKLNTGHGTSCALLHWHPNSGAGVRCSVFGVCMLPSSFNSALSQLLRPARRLPTSLLRLGRHPHTGCLPACSFSSLKAENRWVRSCSS